MSGGSLAAPAPKPGEDMLGEFGDLFGNAQMVFELLQKSPKRYKISQKRCTFNNNFNGKAIL